MILNVIYHRLQIIIEQKIINCLVEIVVNIHKKYWTFLIQIMPVKLRLGMKIIFLRQNPYLFHSGPDRPDDFKHLDQNSDQNRSPDDVKQYVGSKIWSSHPWLWSSFPKKTFLQGQNLDAKIKGDLVNIVGGCVSSYAANYFMGGQQRAQSSTNQNSCWDDSQWDTSWSTPGNSAGKLSKYMVSALKIK